MELPRVGQDFATKQQQSWAQDSDGKQIREESVIREGRGRDIPRKGIFELHFLKE